MARALHHASSPPHACVLCRGGGLHPGVPAHSSAGYTPVTPDQTDDSSPPLHGAAETLPPPHKTRFVRGAGAGRQAAAGTVLTFLDIPFPFLPSPLLCSGTAPSAKVATHLHLFAKDGVRDCRAAAVAARHSAVPLIQQTEGECWR